MSSFRPKKWEVRYLKDMDSMEAAQMEEGEISMEALMAIAPAEGEEGSYRFLLAGPDNIRVHVAVDKILPGDNFKDMYIEAHMVVGDQLKLEKNSVCSKWMDIVDLVNSQDVEVVDYQGNDKSEQFLATLHNYKKDAPLSRSGICMRWLLGTVGDSKKIKLIAQALPCSIDVIEANLSLREDHTLGILVEKFHIFYEAFDDMIASGPIPTFFSTRPDQTLEKLRDNPEFAFMCLQALVSKLLVRREMTR